MLIRKTVIQYRLLLFKMIQLHFQRDLEAKNDYILEEYTFEELAERYMHLGMSELELPRFSTIYFTAN